MTCTPWAACLLPLCCPELGGTTLIGGHPKPGVGAACAHGAEASGEPWNRPTSRVIRSRVQGGCVCVCVCVHVCVCAHGGTCGGHMHASVHVCVRARMCVCAHACVCVAGPGFGGKGRMTSNTHQRCLLQQLGAPEPGQRTGQREPRQAVSMQGGPGFRARSCRPRAPLSWQEQSLTGRAAWLSFKERLFPPQASLGTEGGKEWGARGRDPTTESC